jgi:hypothetical protein
MLWPFDIYYGHLINVMAIWYILWPFDKCYGHLVYFLVIWYIFPRCWYIVPRKIWQPCARVQNFAYVRSIHFHCIQPKTFPALFYLGRETRTHLKKSSYDSKMSKLTFSYYIHIYMSSPFQVEIYLSTNVGCLDNCHSTFHFTWFNKSLIENVC